jgi:hypothetical protein
MVSCVFGWLVGRMLVGLLTGWLVGLLPLFDIDVFNIDWLIYVCMSSFCLVVWLVGLLFGGLLV